MGSIFSEWLVKKEIAAEAIKILDPSFLEVFEANKSKLDDDYALFIYDGSRSVVFNEIQYFLADPATTEKGIMGNPKELPGTPFKRLKKEEHNLEEISLRLNEFYKSNHDKIDYFNDVDSF